MTGLFGSLLSWIFIFVRQSQGKGILPIKLPWEPRQWALVEVLGVVIGALFLNSVLALVVAQALQIEREKGVPLELAAAGGAGSILSVILGTLWICSRYGVTLAHVGFDRLSLKNIVIGIVAGLISLPAMYIVMMAASAVSQSKYEHPLIESAVESATLVTYLLAVFSAAFAAPIAEEFFFRVVLQGWMQSIAFKSLFDNVIGRLGLAPINPPALQLAPTAGGVDPVANSTTESLVSSATIAVEPENSTSPAVDTPQLPMANPIVVASIYEPSAEGFAASVADSAKAGQSPVPPIWPCIVAGILFGFAHFDYGVSFIPLSFLGIFLGWLYRQTQSIWPCIIVHMMLNSFSMIMLGLMILLKQAGVEVGK